MEQQTLERSDSRHIPKAKWTVPQSPSTDVVNRGLKTHPMAGLAQNIVVILPRARVRRWHVWLIDALAAASIGAVTVRIVDGCPGEPAGLTLLMMLERMVYGLAGERASDAIAVGDLKHPIDVSGDEPAGLVVDLSGRDPAGASARTGFVLQPLYDGRPCDLALVGSLVDRRIPLLGMREIALGRTEAYAIGSPASENPNVLTVGFDNALCRIGQSILARVQRIATLAPERRVALAGQPAIAGLGSPEPHMPSSLRGAGLAAMGLAGKIHDWLDRLTRSGRHWRVAWRAMPAHVLSHDVLHQREFTILADDGARYYADPFPIVREGRTFLFVEELPTATGKGVISVTTIGPDGRAEAIRPALEEPWHLSYPHLIEDEGALWMLPEASSNGRLTIYRCTRFPDRWEPAGVLIEGAVHDATVFRHNGRYWMTANVSQWQASSWDTLAVWSAPRLLGPWTPHAANPVLVDVKSARTGGVPFVHEGRLIRPVQDCHGGYGRSLGLAEITRLDDEGYAQRIVGSMRFADADGSSGPHTLNVAGGLQFIDIFGRL